MLFSQNRSASDCAGVAFGLDSLAGVSGATWTADLWLATSGGYPVSMAIIGTKDSTVVYQVSFDITNINDPTNKVTAPAA